MAATCSHDSGTDELFLSFGSYSFGAGLPIQPSSDSRTRTYDQAVNSRLLYQLSYVGIVPIGCNPRARTECPQSLLLLSRRHLYRQGHAVSTPNGKRTGYCPITR